MSHILGCHAEQSEASRISNNLGKTDSSAKFILSMPKASLGMIFWHSLEAQLAAGVRDATRFLKSSYLDSIHIAEG